MPGSAVWAAVEASTSPSTKAAYRSDWGRFDRWAVAAGHQVLLASPMVVAAYLTEAAGERKPDGRPRFSAASLTRWASSINQVHTAAGHPAPGRSEVVRRALSGVRRTRKAPPKRRSPLLVADVRRLLEAMRPSMGVWPTAMAAHRDAALLLMGFAGAHRRSEPVALLIADVTVHPTDGLHVRVRSSKTDQEGQGVVRALPYGRDPLTCPPCALVRWRRLLLAYVEDDGGRPAALKQLHQHGLSTRHVCRDDDEQTTAAAAEGTDDQEPGGGGERWLFPTVHKTGRPGKVMTGYAVAVMIQRRAAAAGFTPAQVDLLGGHSLRSGFVTEAFRAGADAQLSIADGVATITDRNGATHVIEATADPVMCGPCTLVRWRRVLDTEANHKRIKTLFKDAEEVTADSHHPCRSPKPIDPRTLEAKLFPPINQWGQMPFPLESMSPHSASRLARQADTGLAHHRVLDAGEPVAPASIDQAAAEPAPAVARPVYDWEAANQRKMDAVKQLAPLAEALDDIEARIADLMARTNELELD